MRVIRVLALAAAMITVAEVSSVSAAGALPEAARECWVDAAATSTTSGWILNTGNRGIGEGFISCTSNSPALTILVELQLVPAGEDANADHCLACDGEGVDTQASGPHGELECAMVKATGGAAKAVLQDPADYDLDCKSIV